MTSKLSSKTASYGSWQSPVSLKTVAQSAVRLRELCIDTEDWYWLETRPLEGGRGVILRGDAQGNISEVLPPHFSARSCVHEYGGGAFTVKNGNVVFSNQEDNRLYRIAPQSDPQAITPPGPERFADLLWDEKGSRIIAVRERPQPPPSMPINEMVSVSIEGNSAPVTLVSGHDFFSSPCLSPDGKSLAWLSWDHPRMPWQGTDLWVASFSKEGRLEEPKHVAGGPSESIFQPQWSPDGILHFVSDRTGWWNLYRYENEITSALHPMAAEFGRPQWVFGLSTYAFLDQDRILCSYTQNGKWFLAEISVPHHTLKTLPTPYTEIQSVRGHSYWAGFIGGSPKLTTEVVRMNLAENRLGAYPSTSTVAMPTGSFSTPESISFPSTNGRRAHGLYYPPHNPAFHAPADEKPPLIVMSHGGPTAAASTALDFNVQFWTSRGFAVLDVNYGGSTGYGRAYREVLNKQWGVVDVDDCVNGALYLSSEGKADNDRLVIRGSSAGGFTTLAALTFRNVFKAGCSLYGISDLEQLLKDTHKFESHYNFSLIGSLPEDQAVYRERSPIHFTDRLSCPVILLQGLDDKVVPPAQSESFFKALKAKGIPTAYIAFPGEGHGFRKSENIERALEAELYFYSKIFNIELADDLTPITIENLKSN